MLNTFNKKQFKLLLSKYDLKILLFNYKTTVMFTTHFETGFEVLVLVGVVPQLLYVVNHLEINIFQRAVAVLTYFQQQLLLLTI